MSDFYSDMQSVASDILRDFKQGDVRYLAVTKGAGPVDEPGAHSEVSHVVNAAVRGVSQKYVDGSSIIATDRQLTMPANVVTPDISGFVSVDGVRHKIIQIIRKPEAGTPVAWVLIFRK